MIKKKIIVAVITARPSYSRIKTVLLSLRDNPKVDLRIILGSSAILERFGNVSDIIEKDGLKISHKIYNSIEGSNIITMPKTTAHAIVELSFLFNEIKPDAVITIADRYETLATSIAASYMNITLVHIQGGELSGSIDDKVRNSSTVLADIHFTSCEDAKKRVLTLGADPKHTFNLGCPSIDIARNVREKNTNINEIVKKYGGVGDDIDLENQYIVVMQHPVTTEYMEASDQIIQTLESIIEVNMKCIWFWPNIDAGSDIISKTIRQYREKNLVPNIHFYKNMEPEDFLSVLDNCSVLVGNSSVGVREGAYLSVPTVDIGSRQTGRGKSSNIIEVDFVKEEIVSAIHMQIQKKKIAPDFIYGDGQSGKRIADKLYSIL